MDITKEELALHIFLMDRQEGTWEPTDSLESINPDNKAEYIKLADELIKNESIPGPIKEFLEQKQNDYNPYRNK